MIWVRFEGLNRFSPKNMLSIDISEAANIASKH